MTQLHRNLKRLSYVAGFASLPCFAVAVVHSGPACRSSDQACDHVAQQIARFSSSAYECGPTLEPVDQAHDSLANYSKGLHLGPEQARFPGFKARIQLQP
jgi:hypothetical protein